MAKQGSYEPIAVIQHQGSMTADGDAQGHYICDVKWKDYNSWFRTNDNLIPISVLSENVTKKPVVVIYKRIS